MVPATTRSTRQRQAVSDLLRERDDFRNAQQIYAELRDRGESIGLATVYRNLGLLVQLGEVDTLQGADGEALYRQCGQKSAHHHHLVCRQCGRAIEVEAPALEQWAKKLAVEHGFSEVSHTLELFGLCAQCAARPASAQEA